MINLNWNLINLLKKLIKFKNYAQHEYKRNSGVND